VGKKVASLIEGSTCASTQQWFSPCSQWAVCPSAYTAAVAAANSGGLSNSQIYSWQGLPELDSNSKINPQTPSRTKIENLINFWNVWSRSDREPTVCIYTVYHIYTVYYIFMHIWFRPTLCLKRGNALMLVRTCRSWFEQPKPNCNAYHLHDGCVWMWASDAECASSFLIEILEQKLHTTHTYTHIYRACF